MVMRYLGGGIGHRAIWDWSSRTQQDGSGENQGDDVPEDLQDAGGSNDDLEAENVIGDDMLEQADGEHGDTVSDEEDTGEDGDQDSQSGLEDDSDRDDDDGELGPEDSKDDDD